MRTWMRRHPLASFYLLAFAVSWLVALPLIADEQGWITARVPRALHYVAGYGPMVAALVVTYGNGGRAGLRELLARVTDWRVGWGWLAVAVLGPFALLAISAVIARALGSPWLDVRSMGQINYMPDLTVVGVWIFWFLTYGIGEETGWRGFALPHWQIGRSALTASLLLGVLWALWHFPFFFYLDSYTEIGLAAYPFFALSILSGAVVFTWLSNSTGGSVLTAILFHASLNTASATSAAEGMPAMIFSILFVVWAVALVLIYGPARLARADARMATSPAPAA